MATIARNRDLRTSVSPSHSSSWQCWKLALVEMHDLRKIVRRKPQAFAARRLASKDHDTTGGDAAQLAESGSNRSPMVNRENCKRGIERVTAKGKRFGPLEHTDERNRLVPAVGVCQRAVETPRQDLQARPRLRKSAPVGRQSDRVVADLVC